MVCVDTSSAAKTDDATTGLVLRNATVSVVCERKDGSYRIPWMDKAVQWWSWAEVAEIPPRETGADNRRFYPHLPDRRRATTEQIRAERRRRDRDEA